MARSLKTYCFRPGCGQAVIWMKTKNNKNIMINWDSLDEDEKRSALLGIEIPYTRLEGQTFKHIAHWATCKNPPERHKKSKLFD